VDVGIGADRDNHTVIDGNRAIFDDCVVRIHRNDGLPFDNQVDQVIGGLIDRTGMQSQYGN